MRFLLTGLFCLGVCGCIDKDKTSENTKTSQVNPLSDSELVQYQACQSDGDCIYANNGCCDCANSGQAFGGKKVGHGIEIAINGSKKQEFETRFSCEEEKVKCTEKVRMPRCGASKVTCEKNRCTYVPLGGVK